MEGAPAALPPTLTLFESTRRPSSHGRILIAHRHAGLTASMAYSLARGGYAIRTAGSGTEVLDICRTEMPSLVLLALSLPHLSGMTVLRRLRALAGTKSLPVIVLGAAAMESVAVRAFDAGADDYFALEPFRWRELVSRVGALLRRSRARAVPSDQIVEIGTLRFDYASRRVTVSGRELNVTPAETSVLFALADGTLLEKARRTKVTIQRIRAKLGARCDMIETVRGVGYRLRTGSLSTT
jgi:DNA-binding response OmpR family regulator